MKKSLLLISSLLAAGTLGAGATDLTINGGKGGAAESQTISTNTAYDAISVSNGTLTISNNAIVSAASLVASAVDTSSATATINIESGSTLTITGTTTSCDAKIASFMLSNWPGTGTTNVEGVLNLSSGISSRDGTGVLNVKNGGVVNLQAGLIVASDYNTEKSRSLSVTLEDGGRMNIGSAGIAADENTTGVVQGTEANGTTSDYRSNKILLSLGAGTLGILVENGTTDYTSAGWSSERDLEFAGTTLDTQVYKMDSDGNSSAAVANTYGTITLSGAITGSFAVAGDGEVVISSSLTGAFSVEDAGTLDLTGATVTLNAASSNAGTVDLSGATVTLSSSISNTGTVIVSEATSIVLDNMTANSDGAYVIADGTVSGEISLANVTRNNSALSERSTISTTNGLAIIAGATLTWNGGDSGVWKQSEAATATASEGWKLGSADNYFTASDNAIFDSTASTKTVVIENGTTITAGTVSIKSGNEYIFAASDSTGTATDNATLAGTQLWVESGATLKLGATTNNDKLVLNFENISLAGKITINTNNGVDPISWNKVTFENGGEFNIYDAGDSIAFTSTVLNNDGGNNSAKITATYGTGLSLGAVSGSGTLSLGAHGKGNTAMSYSATTVGSDAKLVVASAATLTTSGAVTGTLEVSGTYATYCDWASSFYGIANSYAADIVLNDGATIKQTFSHADTIGFFKTLQIKTLNINAEDSTATISTETAAMGWTVETLTGKGTLAFTVGSANKSNVGVLNIGGLVNGSATDTALSQTISASETNSTFTGTIEVNHTASSGLGAVVALYNSVANAEIKLNTAKTYLAVAENVSIAGLSGTAAGANVYSGKAYPDTETATSALSHNSAASTLTLAGTGIYSYAGTITGVAINKTGAGTQTLSGGITDYSDTVVSSITVSNGILNLSGTNTLSGDVSITNGALNITAGTTTLSGDVTLTANSTTPKLAVASGATLVQSMASGEGLGITLSGTGADFAVSGTLELNATAGDRTNVDLGTVKLLSGSTLKASGAHTIQVTEAPQADNIAALVGVTLEAGENATLEMATSLTVANNSKISGAGTFKIGASQTLTSYIGAVTIDVAKLVADSTGTLSVSGGTTTISASSDISGYEGKISIASNATLEISSMISGGADVDGSTKAAGVTFASGAKLLLTDAWLPDDSGIAGQSEGSSAEQVVLKIICSSAITVADSTVIDSNNASLMSSYVEFDESAFSQYTSQLWAYDDATGILSVTLAIPEPSMFGLLAGTLALALAGTRRRRRGNAKI